MLIVSNPAKSRAVWWSYIAGCKTFACRTAGQRIPRHRSPATRGRSSWAEIARKADRHHLSGPSGTLLKTDTYVAATGAAPSPLRGGAGGGVQPEVMARNHELEAIRPARNGAPRTACSLSPSADKCRFDAIRAPIRSQVLMQRWVGHHAQRSASLPSSQGRPPRPVGDLDACDVDGLVRSSRHCF